MTLLLFIFLGGLFGSAFFSAMEMAFVSCNKLRLRHLADEGNSAAQRITLLFSRSQEFLSSVLIGNNIVNISATAALTLILQEFFSIRNEWAATAIFIPIFLILGELAPKDLGRLRAERLLLSASWFLTWWVNSLRGPVYVLTWVVDRMLGRFRTVMHKNIFVSQNEFKTLIEESTRSGILDPHERRLIDTILDFEKIRLDSVMIPLEKAHKVDITATVGDVQKLGRSHDVRMVLVYEELPSIVMGMVYVYDLLFEKDAAKPLREYLRSPIFLPVSASIERAFLTLQQKRQSFAVVIDEHSEAVGVVPVERLIDF